jgi:hypothetical protein
MTLTIEGVSVPAMGLTRARGGQGGMLLATRRAKRIEADADTPSRLILGNNAVAAKRTSPGGSELSSFTACELPHSNRAGHGVC